MRCSIAGQHDLVALLFEPGIEYARDGAAEPDGIVGGEQAGHRLARKLRIADLDPGVAVAREGLRRLPQGLALEGQLAVAPGQVAGDGLRPDRLWLLGERTRTGPAACWIRAPRSARTAPRDRPGPDSPGCRRGSASSLRTRNPACAVRRRRPSTSTMKGRAVAGHGEIGLALEQGDAACSPRPYPDPVFGVQQHGRAVLERDQADLAARGADHRPGGGTPTPSAATAAAAATPPVQVSAWRRDTPERSPGRLERDRIEVRAQRLGGLAHQRQGPRRSNAPLLRDRPQPGLECSSCSGVSGPRSSRAVQSDAA